MDGDDDASLFACFISLIMYAQILYIRSVYVYMYTQSIVRTDLILIRSGAGRAHLSSP